MKQQNKYLALAIPSILTAAGGAFACYVTEQSNVFGVAMFVWAVGCVCAIACLRGFADCQNCRNKSYMIDRYGALWGLRRRFLGLEYDSVYQRRITNTACNWWH